MALSGNLRDFSLPDVFQLVSFSHKTGTLAIDRGDAKGFVYFKEGEVFFAISNWNREPMGRRLVRGEKITDRQLHKALEIQKADKEHRRLGQILVDEGFLTPKVLQTFVQEQIQDTIFDLFRWEEGEFDFKADVIPTDEDIGLSVSVENIIMEGSRRLEEWDRIRKKIPTLEATFKMATQPGEGTFEIGLKPSEWKLLCLLDGHRTVGDLSNLLDMSDFEVSRVLYGMFSGGLLERVDAEAPPVDVTEAPPVEIAETPPETEATAAAPPEEAVEAQPDGEATPEVTAPPRLEVVPEVEAVPAEPEVAVEEQEEIAELSVEAEAAETGEAAPASSEAALTDVELAEALGEETPATEVTGEEEGASEAVAPTPEVEVAEEPKVEPAQGADEESQAQVAAVEELVEEEMDVGDLELADELTALTGGAATKSRAGAGRPKVAKADVSDVPLHVDKRVSKDLLLRIIEGIKRL